MFGLPTEAFEPSYTAWAEHVEPEDLARISAHFQEWMASSRREEQWEFRFIRPDGEIRQICARGILFRNNEGQAVRMIGTNQDVTELKRAEEAVRSQKEDIENIFNLLPAQIWYKDAHNRVLRVNDQVCRDIGIAREDIEGHQSEEIFPLFAEEYYKDDMEVITSGRPKLGIEEQINTASGDILWIKTDKVPVKDTQGHVVGVLAIVADLTEQKRTEEALKQAKNAAEAANNAKDRFLAVLSHELRTPLTPVLATVSALQTQQDLNEELREDMDLIRRNVEMESKLIDDLLDVTRISRGTIALHLEVVDVCTVLRTALEICQKEIGAKHLDISMSFQAATHHVRADPTRLRQVFWNLIKNAVEFTPEGGRISLRTSNIEGRLRIEVADTGIGIRPELLPKIFNAFERGDQTTTRRFGGLGLGLNIVKTVLELHHGSVTAFSEGQGKGTTFTVELPAVTPAQQSAAPPASIAPQERPQKILLVDDHPDTLLTLAKLLRRGGYFVVTADGVQTALELASKESFDVLISDLGLADGSGLEIMRELKHAYHLRGIAFSGYGTEEDIRKSREAGFEDHLTKPVNFETLRAAVQRITSKTPDRDFQWAG